MAISNQDHAVPCRETSVRHANADHPRALSRQVRRTDGDQEREVASAGGSSRRPEKLADRRSARTAQVQGEARPRGFPGSHLGTLQLINRTV